MGDKEGNNRKKDQTRPPEKIVYGTVFENHDFLMEGYKSVLKKSISTGDIFCRTKFVESHIYKKLKKVRKIYSVEIATLPDLNTHRKTFEELVKKIDEFLGVLFYFPTITLKGLISLSPAIVAAVGIVIGIIIHLHSIEALGLDVVNNKFILALVSILLGSLVVIFSLISFSFMEKRFLFVFFSEDKLQEPSKRVKSMRKAFVGKDIKETCYDKENKLFQSLVVIKEPEQPVDIVILAWDMLFCICIFFPLVVRLLDFLPLTVVCLLWVCLCISPIIFMLYFQVKRKAK